jgi:hypothetical protein
MNNDAFDRIFGGGYPWPDWDELRRQRTSPDANAAKAAREVERAIEVASEWLEGHAEAFEWSSEKEAELHQAVTSACPGCSERLHEAIRKYISWYGWHEGILRLSHRPLRERS